MKRLLSIFIVLTLLASGSIQATECFEASPMAKTGKGPIEALTPVPITHEQYRLLIDFLSSLPPRWSGAAKRTECLGEIGQAHVAVTDYTARGEISLDSNNNLTINMNQEFEKTTFNDLSMYELPETMLTAADNEDGSISTQILGVTQDSAEIYFKSVIALNKQTKDRGGVRAMEHLYVLNRSGTKLEIERKIYLSGLLVQIDNWRLKKGK